MPALWLLGLLWGCPGVTKSTRKAAPKQAFSLQSRGSCLEFRDHRTGLHFCVPTGTRLQRARSFKPHAHASFEVRMRLAQSSIELHLRRDPLPSDLPEGALSGPWLLRYVEGYARHRGALAGRFQRRVLHPKRSRFLRADAAVWAGFPLPESKAHQWEEVLVLSRNHPPTRQLISIRMASQDRSNPSSLRTFLTQFLKSMRLDKP